LASNLINVLSARNQPTPHLSALHSEAGFHHGSTSPCRRRVDPHVDTIHVAVLTAVGKVVGDAEFPTTAVGYARAVEFLTDQGIVDRVGVEGAASYGAGITRCPG